jgi:hypothetical protein
MGWNNTPLAFTPGASGVQVHDTVSVGPLTSKHQSFLLANEYSLTLQDHDMPIDGIMGLGPRGSSKSSQSFFWNLYDQGQLDAGVFSFWIPGDDVWINDTELTLGGINPGRYYGPINYTNFETKGDSYSIALSNLYLNEKPLYDKAIYSKPYIAVLDTATPFIQTPDYETAKALHASISPVITQVDPNGGWGAPCDFLYDMAYHLLPNMTFELGRPALNLTLPYFWYPLRAYPGLPEGICLTIFSHPVEPTGHWIIGSALLKNYFTVWDPINMNIGWAMAAPFD